MKYLFVLLVILFIVGCAKKQENNPLAGEWVSVDSTETITLSKKNAEYDSEADLTDYNCQIDVYVSLENSFAREMIFHYQEVDGKMIAVLSDTLFEADGRGTIITEEYVKKDDKENLPDDFESDLSQRYNNTPAVPTYIEE